MINKIISSGTEERKRNHIDENLNAMVSWTKRSRNHLMDRTDLQLTQKKKRLLLKKTYFERQKPNSINKKSPNIQESTTTIHIYKKITLEILKRNDFYTKN